MIRRLLILNGLAILGVILFHASGWGFVAMFAWVHRYMPTASSNFEQAGSATYYVFRLIEQLIEVSIPAFLFVSGFFVAFATERVHKTVSWNIIGARIKNLLIPYLFWSLLVFVAWLVLDGRRLSLVEYGRLLLIGGASPAYYYVILLCQFYILSPFLVPLAKNHWKSLLLAALILQLVVQILQYPVILGLDVPTTIQPFVDKVPKWLFPARAFWFTLGVVFGFHMQTLKAWVTRYKWVWLGLAIVTYVLGVIEWEMYIKWSGHIGMTHRETVLDNIYSIAFIFAFFAFANMPMPFSRQLGNLGSKSFGIYMAHVPVMEYIARAIYLLVPWLLAHQLLFLSILIVLGLGIPLLLMMLMEKSPVQKYYQYVFG